MDLEQLLSEAIEATKTVLPGQVFVLKSLFEGYKWEPISNGNKRYLGQRFKKEVIAGRVPNVAYYGKAANNSSKYIKNNKEEET